MVVANRFFKSRNRELHKTAPNPTKPAGRQQSGGAAALQSSCDAHLLNHVWGAEEEDVSPKIKLWLFLKKKKKKENLKILTED